MRYLLILLVAGMSSTAAAQEWRLSKLTYSIPIVLSGSGKTTDHGKTTNYNASREVVIDGELIGLDQSEGRFSRNGDTLRCRLQDREVRVFLIPGTDRIKHLEFDHSTPSFGTDVVIDLEEELEEMNLTDSSRANIRLAFRGGQMWFHNPGSLAHEIYNSARLDHDAPSPIVTIEIKRASASVATSEVLSSPALRNHRTGATLIFEAESRGRELQLLDVEGKVIETDVVYAGLSSASVDLRDRAAGVYFIWLEGSMPRKILWQP